MNEEVENNYGIINDTNIKRSFNTSLQTSVKNIMLAMVHRVVEERNRNIDFAVVIKQNSLIFQVTISWLLSTNCTTINTGFDLFCQQ